MFIPCKQKIGNQSLRRETVEYAALLCIFGVGYFNVSDYIVKRTKKVFYIHLPSTSAMKALFTLDGKCYAEVHRGTRIFVASSKVVLKKEGKNIFGYVLNDDGGLLCINLCTDEIITMTAPRHVKGKYIMGEVEDGYEWVNLIHKRIHLEEYSSPGMHFLISLERDRTT